MRVMDIDSGRIVPSLSSGSSSEVRLFGRRTDYWEVSLFC